MSGLTGAMFTALSGLDAFSKGTETVSNNVANQATSGYAVESLAPQTVGNSSSGAGSGVLDPPAVRRAADGFAATRVYAATATSQGAQSLASALSTIDQAFTGNGNIHSAASTFFADLSTLASEPTNAAQASTAIADAQTLVGAFQSAAGSLDTQFATISNSVQQQVANANKLLGQVAAINKSLQASPNSNTLLDQQQAALTALAKYVSISTVPLSNGAVEVTTGGTVLVDQSGAQLLDITQSTPSSLPVVNAGADKAPVNLGKTSGSLGGSLAGFTATSNALASLNWFAGALSGLVNQAQAEGLNGSGKQGTPLFLIPAPTVTPAATNTGSATLGVTITNSSQLPPNGQGYTLTFGPGGWTATTPNTNQTYGLGAGPTLTLNGMSVAVTGTPKPGDSFQIDPTPGAAAGLGLTSTNPAMLAVADPYAVTSGTISPSGAVINNNAGTVTETSDTVLANPTTGAAVVPGPYFGQSLIMTFTSPSAYKITTAGGATVSSGTWSGGTSVAIAYPSSSKASGEYWQVNLTGTPTAGDVVSLTPGGLNSGSNAARMAQLWDTSNAFLPGGSLQGSILSIIGFNGAQSAAANTMHSNSANNLQRAQNSLAAIAGVNPDQQATLLVQYQQAYAAAAKVIAIAETMFNSLLQAV